MASACASSAIAAVAISPRQVSPNTNYLHAHVINYTLTKNLVIEIFQCLTLVIGLATDFLNRSLSRLLNNLVIDLEIHLKNVSKWIVKLVTISHHHSFL